VTPESDSQTEAFAVVRKALADTNKAGLGKIAVGGREHLMAITVPGDESLPGLMGYALRYAEELRNPAEFFEGIKTPRINEESLALAKELIERKSAKFNPSKFTDEYEAALREMIDAKLKHLPMPKEEKPASRGKVINLMDALRKSVEAGDKRPPAHATNSRKSSKHGVIEMPARAKRRKSA
jgi:DNA end-binding protein Ku